MRINSENKQAFDDLDLHDAELLDINCDYRNQVVSITARLYIPEKKSQVIHLAFKEFSYFLISCKEPWGSGVYFLGATVDEAVEEGDKLVWEDGKIFVILTLNSGDHIKIVSSWVEWSLE